MSQPPIGPYPQRPLGVQEADARTVRVAEGVTALVRAKRPDVDVVHIGSSAVPGLAGKVVVDLGAMEC